MVWLARHRPFPLGQLVCSDEEEDSPSFVHLPPSADGTGGFYDRQGRVVCSPERIEEGDAFTLFAFNSPRWNREVDPFPQHTMLFMYLDANRTATELTETFPATYGRWCAIRDAALVQLRSHPTPTHHWRPASRCWQARWRERLS